MKRICGGTWVRWSILSIVALASLAASACSAVIVGKAVSATGRVIVGHNNDGPGPFVFRQALVPARDGRAQMFWSEVKATAGGPYAGDHFLNEHGVLIVSNGAGIMDEWDGTKAPPQVREDAAACVDGGVAYAFRRTVAERARSAREAVEIATNLLSCVGYSLYMGRNFTIADANEAWVLETPGGRRYAARRCPDDAVVAVPNSFTIDRIRPDDLVSPNIAAKGEGFDFVRAYQGARTWRSNYSYYRMKGLYAVVAGVDVGEPEECPFSVRPNRKISVEDVKRGLRTHYEGLPWAGAVKHPPKDPKTRTPVCRDGTIQSIVCAFGATAAETGFGLLYGRPCEHEYELYRPFAGSLPSTAVTGAEAWKRLDEHEIPLGKENE